MQAFVVTTGSLFPTAADATTVPVTTIGPQDMQVSGIGNNLLNLLGKTMPAFAGRSMTGTANAMNTNQYTAGGSQLALRNLDTLVLINGRRVATSGINAVNGKSFVDINQIPTAAIDHIEVLADGASAIYGSDAVGGVINIILKSDYKGAEIGGRYGFAAGDGHYTERSGYVVAGASHHGVNLTVSASWAKTDPLWESQRAFISDNPRSGTNLPGFVAGAYLNPKLDSPSQTNAIGANATAASMADLVANGTYSPAGDPAIPTLNVAPDEMILLQEEKRGVVADFTAHLAGNRLVAFGDFLYSKTKSFDQTSAFLNNLAAVTVPAGAPYNPVTAAVPGVVVARLDTPLQTYNNSTGLRFTVGFRGQLSPHWNWEIGATSSQSKTDQQLKNELFVPNLAAAIAGGYNASGQPETNGPYSKELSGFSVAANQYVYVPALDPFARAGVDPASLAYLYGTELINTKSTLDSYDAKLVGTPFSLPGGRFGIAVGAATRKEKLAGTPDQNAYNLSTSAINHNWGGGAVFFDPFTKSRTVDSYYAELRIPITGPNWNVPGLHSLELSLAGRTDKYSDAGTSNTPKIGLRWAPVDNQFVIRFTYSKAFTAPLLYDEYGPPSVGLASGNSFLYNFVLNPAGQKNPSLIGLPYYSGNGNNPNIKPSTAVSRSLGIVISPKALKGFTLSLNYVNVFQKGLAAGLGASTIVSSVNALGSASPFISQIAVGAMPGTPGASQTALSKPGGLYQLLTGGSYNDDLYILDHKVNSGGVHVEALDIAAYYDWPTALGRFDFSTTGTYLRSFKVEDLPTLPFYEYAGYATNGKTMSGTLPQFSFYTTVTWRHGPWDLTAGNRYMSSMTDIQVGQVPQIYLQTHKATTVNYYATLDLQVGYTFARAAGGGLRAILGGTHFVVGINNVFNRMPPYSPLAQAASLNNANVDVATYSPIGRLIFVSFAKKF